MNQDFRFPSSETVISGADCHKPLIRVRDFSAIARFCDYFNARAAATGNSCGFVLKSDAYGFGTKAVANLLHEKGAKVLFTSDIWEAISIRDAVPDRDVRIYTLHGFDADNGTLYKKHGISPVLNTPGEAEHYAAFCRENEVRGSAALQIDTGMNRCGLTPEQLPAFAAAHDALAKDINFDFYLTHLYAVDLSLESSQEISLKQLALLEECLKGLPPLPVSVTATHGTLYIDHNPDLSTHVPQQIQRVGVGMFGDLQDETIAFHMFARINHIRTVKAGGAIGYDGDFTAPKDMKVAVVDIGYGDGYPRHLSTADESPKPDSYMWVNGHKAPVLGKIAMNLTCIDVTDIPQDVLDNTPYVEVVGSHVDIRTLAQQAGLTPEDVLIGLNRPNVRAETFTI